MLISRQWWFWPLTTVGIGLGLLACSKAIRILHPGPIAEKPISFATGEPVSITIERRFKMMVEVRLRVDKLGPDEPNVSSLQRPKLRLDVSGAETNFRDYEQPAAFSANTVDFEYAWVTLRTKSPATFTVNPSPESAGFDQRRPKLVIHEFHPDWGGFFAISIFANWIGAGCILMGLGTWISRRSIQVRWDRRESSQT